MKLYLRPGAFVTLAFLLLSAGCESDDTITYYEFRDMPVEILLTAPREIKVADQEYMLETYLWRDFMPVSPPGGKLLIALIQVVELNEAPIAPDLELEYLWIIHDREIWFTTFTDEIPPSPEHELHRIARDGPRWDPGTEVDVIVGLSRGNGPIELLRAPGQMIRRTD